MNKGHLPEVRIIVKKQFEQRKRKIIKERASVLLLSGFFSLKSGEGKDT